MAHRNSRSVQTKDWIAVFKFKVTAKDQHFNQRYSGLDPVNRKAFCKPTWNIAASPEARRRCQAQYLFACYTRSAL